MRRNIAGQKVGAQVLTTAGAAFTGTVTVYVTKDAGTQALGSVGSGVCVHEGNGYHTYAPAQAETDGDLVACTFIGTGASPVTMSYETQPHTLLADATSGLFEVYDIVNNLVGADATLSVATLAAICDKLLGRNHHGGSDGGQTVSKDLKRIGNRTTLGGAAGDSPRTMTVYENDDVTVAFTVVVTYDANGNVVTFTPST